MIIIAFLKLIAAFYWFLAIISPRDVPLWLARLAFAYTAISLALDGIDVLML